MSIKDSGGGRGGGEGREGGSGVGGVVGRWLVCRRCTSLFPLPIPGGGVLLIWRVCRRRPATFPRDGGATGNEYMGKGGARSSDCSVESFIG